MTDADSADANADADSADEAAGSADADGTRGRAVVLKFYLYRAVGNPGFIYPIYVLYMLSHGLSYAEIGVIGAVQSVVVVGGELPTGYVGDRIGRRNSLLVAQVVFVASALLFLAADGFVGFTVGFALLSVGMTFVSGSADAWLYDVLAERLDADRYTHVRGRAAAIGQWVMAATMIAGSLLYVVEPAYPFVALLVMRVVTFGVVLSLPKTARYADRDGSDADPPADAPSDDTDADDASADATADDHLTVLEALPIIRTQLAAPPLRSFVAYVALFVGAASTVDAFVQPITVDALESTAASLLAAVGVPEAASLGVLYAAFTVVSAIASDRASDLEAALGVRTAMLVVPPAVAVLLVLPAFAPVLAFPMFFGLKAAQSALRPIVGQHLNDHVESVGRATVLSAVSMVYAVVRVPYALGSGVVADHFSPLVAVAALGGAFLVAGGLLAAWRPPVPKESASGTPEAAAGD
jgi:MFS family permease